MLRTDLLTIIRSLNTVYTAIGICHASYVYCLLADSQLAWQIIITIIIIIIIKLLLLLLILLKY